MVYPFTADVEMKPQEETNRDKIRNIPNGEGEGNKMIVDETSPQNEEFGFVTVEEKCHLLSKNIDILETLSAVCTKVDIVKVVVKYLLEYLYFSKGK